MVGEGERRRADVAARHDSGGSTSSTAESDRAGTHKQVPRQRRCTAVLRSAGGAGDVTHSKKQHSVRYRSHRFERVHCDLRLVEVPTPQGRPIRPRQDLESSSARASCGGAYDGHIHIGLRSLFD